MLHEWVFYPYSDLRYCLMCGIMSTQMDQPCKNAKVFKVREVLIPKKKKGKKK